MARPLKMKPRVRPRDTIRGSKALPKRIELDRLCKEVVFRRDAFCRRCGKTSGQQHWAHIYSRRFLSIRWNPLNSMRLCAGCHFWAHQNPIEAGQFFQASLKTEELAYLLTTKNCGKTPDRLTTKLMLKALLK